MTTVRPIRLQDRADTLRVRRILKMSRSAHAFVRGNTVQFYRWLDDQKLGALPRGPSVWICGDCHVGNLGPVADKEGRVAIQIRHLDQTVIGNPAHDLIRLALSIATASRGSDLPGIAITRMLEQVMQGYLAALTGDLDRIEEPPKLVKLALKQSVSRSWKSLAVERIANVKPSIPRGSKFWSLSAAETVALTDLFKTPEMHRLAKVLRSRDEDAKVKIVDAAYWMKGCSSLGKLRFAVLLAIGGKKHRDLALMDVKEAAAPEAPHDPDRPMPHEHAKRVVEGARHLSPFLGERMVAGRLNGRSVFTRELMPQDLKLEMETLTVTDATKAASYLAAIVGRAHARQMTEAVRKAWAADLMRNRSKSLNAPSWLWQCVVALIGYHETAYLEHCRRFAAEYDDSV